MPSTRGTPGRAPALALTLGLLLASGSSHGAQSVITPSPAQLQSHLREHFPLRGCLLELACLGFAQPQVRLISGDPLIYLSVVAAPEFGRTAFGEGVVELRGEPRYEASKGEFYLSRAEFTRLEFPDLTPQQSAIAAELGGVILAELLARRPVWRLDERDARQALAKLVLRRVEVRGGRLLLIVGDEDPAEDRASSMNAPGPVVDDELRSSSNTEPRAAERSSRTRPLPDRD